MAINDTPTFCPYKGLEPYAETDRRFFFGRKGDSEIIAANLNATTLTVLHGASGVGKSSVLMAGVVPKLKYEVRYVVAPLLEGADGVVVKTPTQPTIKTSLRPVIVFRNWQTDDFVTALKRKVLTTCRAVIGETIEVATRTVNERLAYEKAALHELEELLYTPEFKDAGPDTPEENQQIEPTEPKKATQRQRELVKLAQHKRDLIYALNTFAQFLENEDAFDFKILQFDDLLAICNLASSQPVFLIFDQFEEYFLYHPASDTKASFDAEFARAVNRQDVEANFLLSLREDGLSNLDRFQGRIPNLLGNMLRLEHLDLGSAIEAMTEPLAEHNRLNPGHSGPIEIEDALVQALLDQVRTGRVTLDQAGQGQVSAQGNGSSIARIETPFLQMVLIRLWEEEYRKNSRKLQLNTLKSLGGARTIVRTHLDGVMNKLKDSDAEYPDIAARFFRFLVTPAGMKIAHTLGTLAAWTEMPEEEMRPVIEALIPVRILRPVDPPLGQTTGTRYEVFHDVLAPAILDWRGRHEAERQKAEKQKQLEAAEKQAELERQRAEEHERLEQIAVRSARQLRIGLVIISALLIAVAGIAIYALTQRRTAIAQTKVAELASAEAIKQKDVAQRATADALAQKDVAEQAQADAVEQKEFAERQRKEAEIAKNEAQEARDRLAIQNEELIQQKKEAEAARAEAFSRELAANAIRQTQLDPELATVLAIRSAQNWTDQTDDALRSSLPLVPESERPIAVPNNRVWAASLSPDGTQVITVGDTNFARILDSRTGNLLKELIGHTDEVTSATFSRDKKFIATTSRDRTTRIWDGQTFAFIRELPGHEQAVTGAVFSPDGKLLVTRSEDHTARVLRTDTWQTIEVLMAPKYLSRSMSVDAVRFSGDSRFLAIVDNAGNGEVRDGFPAGLALIWRTTSFGFGKPELLKPDRPIMEEYEIHDASLSQDGSLIATASDDGIVRIWSPETGNFVRELRGHTGSVWTAKFSPNGQYLLSSSDDGTARVWRVNTGESVLVMNAYTDDQGRAEFSADGKSIITVDPTGKEDSVRIWSWDINLVMTVTGSHGLTRELNSVAYSPDGKFIVTVGGEGVAKIWKTDSGEYVKEFAGNVISKASFSPDGEHILGVCNADGIARIWSMNGEPMASVELPGFGSRATTAQYNSDGQVVLIGDEAGKLHVWNLVNKKELTINAHYKAVSSAVFSPDDRLIASASIDGTRKVWDASTGVLVKNLTDPFAQEIGADVAFNKDGTKLAFAEARPSIGNYLLGSAVEIFETRGFTLVGVLGQGHAKPIRSVAFSPDGRLVVTAGDDGTARIWELADSKAKAGELKLLGNNGILISVLRSQGRGFSRATFSPDGRFIATAGQDGLARIYPQGLFASGETLRQLASTRKLRKLTEDERWEYLHEDPQIPDITNAPTSPHSRSRKDPRGKPK